MVRPGLSIRTAAAPDVDGIVRLLDRCYDTAGSGLAQRFGADQVAGYVAGAACAVAVAGGSVLGAVITQPLPEGGEAGPVTRAMLDAFPPLAGSYVYGPVAVDPVARGAGLARRMADHVLAHHPVRTGILFVDDRNAASLRVHAAPPFRRLGRFTFRGQSFTCLALSAADTAVSTHPETVSEDLA